MKKLDLAQGITVLANLGVIAGIVFLGVELSQNNELMAAQQRFNRLTTATGTFTAVAENPELAEAIVKANSDPDSLTAAEEMQLSMMFWRVLRNQEWTFFELPREELPVDEWRYNPTGFASWCATWTIRRDQLASEFVQFLEEDVGVRCE